MAGEVLVDALPYIDQGYDDPEVRDAALLLVEEECRRYRPTKNYLEHLPQLNMPIVETELMKNEFERIQNRLPMEPLNMKRYELPLPPHGKSSELSAWTECVDNSMAQLEHQATRAINLELMLEHGCETWKNYLEILASLQAKAQHELQNINKEVQEVNWQRKTKQKDAGEKLRMLEEQWVTLVSKNYEIEQACADLAKKIAERKSELGLLTPANEQQNGVNGVDENGNDENNDEKELETVRSDEVLENESQIEETAMEVHQENVQTDKVESDTKEKDEEMKEDEESSKDSVTTTEESVKEDAENKDDTENSSPVNESNEAMDEDNK